MHSGQTHGRRLHAVEGGPVGPPDHEQGPARAPQQAAQPQAQYTTHRIAPHCSYIIQSLWLVLYISNEECVQHVTNVGGLFGNAKAAKPRKTTLSLSLSPVRLGKHFLLFPQIFL